jgi:hypothetical protein
MKAPIAPAGVEELTPFRASRPATGPDAAAALASCRRLADRRPASLRVARSGMSGPSRSGERTCKRTSSSPSTPRSAALRAGQHRNAAQPFNQSSSHAHVRRQLRRNGSLPGGGALRRPARFTTGAELIARHVDWGVPVGHPHAVDRRRGSERPQPGGVLEALPGRGGVERRVVSAGSPPTASRVVDNATWIGPHSRPESVAGPMAASAHSREAVGTQPRAKGA